MPRPSPRSTLSSSLDTPASGGRRAVLGGALAAGALWLAGRPARALAAAPDERTEAAAGFPVGPLAAAGLALPFGGVDFLHRWSRDGQHEFTPAGEEDLATWRSMLTLNVHARAQSGESLAELANAVLTRYRDNGKVLTTRSVPRTATRPAEHLIVAVLGRPQSLETAFARFQLHEGSGLVTVRSHRIHGQAVGPEMSRWLAAEGLRTEETLMAWKGAPTLARLNGLHQARGSAGRLAETIETRPTRA